MSLNIPNAPNAGLFKGGYNKFVTPFPPYLPATFTYCPSPPPLQVP